jgi:hypothetical protein
LVFSIGFSTGLGIDLTAVFLVAFFTGFAITFALGFLGLRVIFFFRGARSLVDKV